MRKRSLPTLFAFLTTASAALAAPTTGPTTAPATFPARFGIASSGESFGDHARLFPLLRDAGTGMVRSFPEWASLEPTKGNWNWADADALMESARRNDVEIAGMLAYLAPWASSAPAGEKDQGKRTRTMPVKDMADWSNFVGKTVGRYAKDVRYWEVYNEFNSPGFARGGTPAQYAEMVKSAAKAAREANPNVRIGIGCADVDISFLEAAITAGAGGQFDFLNVHPYSLMDAAMAGREPVFLRMGENLRKMLKKTGQRPDVEIWVSEVGRQAVNKPEPEQRQAEALAKAYVLCLAQGVERVFWFEGRGRSYGKEGEFGFIRQDWSPRPAYLAAQTMAATLGKRPQYAGWLEPAGKSYGFVFQAAEPVLVTWAGDEQGTMLKVPAGATVTDLTGNQMNFEAFGTVRLTRTPVYVRNLPAAMVEAARANQAKPFPWLKDYGAAKTVSLQTGTSNVESGIVQATMGDGKTAVGLVDGVHVRRTDKAGKSPYVYFDVDDSYASVGDAALEITITARRVDPAKKSGFDLTYESSKGYRGTGDWWTIPADDGWHSHTFKVDNAHFANNWGWNFRIDATGSAGDLWVREVTVRRAGEKK